MKKTIFLLFTVFILSSCAGPYSNKDNGKTIELSEDDSFQVVLKADAGSLYQWELTSKNTIIELSKPLEVEKQSGGNEYVFNFKTIAAGEEILEFNLTDDENVKEVYQLKVIVGTMGRILSE